MKAKSRKNFAALFLFGMAAPMLASCGSPTFDRATTIYIEPFSGSGFGYEWINDLAEEWKEETGANFNIMVDSSSTYMASNQLDQIASGVSKTDVFFGAEPDYNPGIYKGYFEDLTDLLDVRPDGEGAKTIKEKIPDWGKWELIGSKSIYDETTDSFRHEGMYMLPYTSSICGLIFDYDKFSDGGLLTKAAANDETKAALEEQGISYHVEGTNLVFDSSVGYTNYESGDIIMRAGKDGKYGTYDDGQPETIEEFNSLVGKVEASGKTPFIHNKQGGYLDSAAVPVLTQMMGQDLYNALTTFDSQGKEIELFDGASKSIDWSNGYEVYKTKGMDDMLNFIYDNFYNKQNGNRFISSNQVSQAQSKFINGLINDNEFIAFINEGNWMEHEASETFKAAAKRGGKKYGEYDLRFLLYPAFANQKGMDGNGAGSYLSGPEYGAICVRKQEDPEKLKAIKSFISFVLRNDNMAKVNVKTGLTWAYEYTISDALKGEMTVFQRNCYDILQDSKNVKVLSTRTDKLAAPFSYASRSFINTSNIIPVGKNAYSISGAFQMGSKPAEIANDIRNMYSQNSWNDVINEAKFQLS